MSQCFAQRADQMKKLIWHFEDQNLTGNVLKLSESNNYDEADQMKTSSEDT